MPWWTALANRKETDTDHFRTGRDQLKLGPSLIYRTIWTDCGLLKRLVSILPPISSIAVRKELPRLPYDCSRLIVNPVSPFFSVANHAYTLFNLHLVENVCKSVRREPTAAPWISCRLFSWFKKRQIQSIYLWYMWCDKYMIWKKSIVSRNVNFEILAKIEWKGELRWQCYNI